MPQRDQDIFSDTVKRRPVILTPIDIKGESHLVGIYEKESGTIGKTQHIAVLYEMNGIWHLGHEYELDEMPCYALVESNYEVIKDGQYFFFERVLHHVGTMFQGTASVEFSLLEIQMNKLNRFLYNGLERMGGVQGNLHTDRLESSDKKFCQNFLKFKFSQSNNVYRTPIDYNLDDPKNYIQKWEIHNADFYSNEYGTVNFCFYETPILCNDEIQSLVEAKSLCDHVENESYVLFLCFAGTVVAFRKSDGKYFSVLVPEGWGGGGGWGMRSFQTLRLTNLHEAYTRCEYEQYEINLETGSYHRYPYEKET